MTNKPADVSEKIRCHNCGKLHEILIGETFGYHKYYRCSGTGSIRGIVHLRTGKNYSIADEDEWKGWTGDEDVESAS